MSEQNGKVVVTDIDIPFGRLVVLFVKFALAAIPAGIIAAIIMAVIMTILGGIFGGMGLMMGPRGF